MQTGSDSQLRTGLNFGYRRFQKAGRPVETAAHAQTNTGTTTPVSNGTKPSTVAASGPASQNRPLQAQQQQQQQQTPAQQQQQQQPRKVNPVEPRQPPAQTSSTPVPSKPSTNNTAPTVNPPPANIPSPAQSKPTPTGPAKASPTAPTKQPENASITSSSQPPASQQSTRPERKTSNRFEKPELKERENPWTKANGQEPTERPGKKVRAPKAPRDKDAPEGSKPSSAKRELPTKTDTSKPDSDKENAPDAAETNAASKKIDVEDGPDRINGERSTRPALNPYTLYIKGLPAGVTQDMLKGVWDEAIRAKVRVAEWSARSARKLTFSFLRYTDHANQNPP